MIRKSLDHLEYSGWWLSLSLFFTNLSGKRKAYFKTNNVPIVVVNAQISQHQILFVISITLPNLGNSNSAFPRRTANKKHDAPHEANACHFF